MKLNTTYLRQRYRMLSADTERGTRDSTINLPKSA